MVASGRIVGWDVGGCWTWLVQVLRGDKKDFVESVSVAQKLESVGRRDVGVRGGPVIGESLRFGLYQTLRCERVQRGPTWCEGNIAARVRSMDMAR